ncbi:MAG: NADH-quinone oxidoreductase subunit NuoH [Oligoflexia bacterium]|nr:NADH-quinone oxidoreductase subunit NuoH [Oligoflexia bacterium]
MDLINIVATLIKIILLFAISLTAVAFCTWLERRGAAWIQGRRGPCRVGPFGLLQPVADGIKFFFKESFVPEKSNKFFYLAAPILTLTIPFLAMVSIPFAENLYILNHEIPMRIARFDSGILLVIAFTGLEVYPVMIGGWASNNKFSVLGSLRAASQMIAYEISMGLALLSMILVYGTFDMNEMVRFQEKWMWGCFINPIAALIFWFSIFAETNRLPCDIPEGESEIVAGYHLEYGAMKFALFFMSEYVAMIMASALIATLFFGGYSLLPGFSLVEKGIVALFSIRSEIVNHNLFIIFQLLSIFLKIAFFMFVFIWVRWTLPRFRFDQLMDLGWKILFPLALANVLLMGIVSYFFIYR